MRIARLPDPLWGSVLKEQESIGQLCRVHE